MGKASKLAELASAYATGGLVGMRNRIINGAMMIDQRNAGASVAVTATNTFVVDRFYVYGSQASKLTAQQNAGSVTPPVGFSKYLGFTSLSAYSVLAADIFYTAQKIEGFNTADLAWGTANASSVTLSFKVYSSLTGTFGGSINNEGSNYCYPFTYSIPVANTWTTISVTIAGPTAGTWAGATNGIGLYVSFGLGVGSTSSGTAGAWASGTYFSATGATSVVGTSGATFYITGVQLEKGSTATSFDYRPYGTELALCQRYFWQGFAAGNGVSWVYCDQADSAGPFIPTPIMRVTPSLAILTAPVYNSCTSFDLTTAGSGNAGSYHRISPSPAGAKAMRAYGGIYSANAEL